MELLERLKDFKTSEQTITIGITKLVWLSKRLVANTIIPM